MSTQNAELITYWQSTDNTNLPVLSKATADSVMTRLIALRKRSKRWDHTNIGPTTGSTILDTGILSTPFTNVAHLVSIDAHVLAQTLAASQEIGVLVRVYNSAGTELDRSEARYGVSSAISSLQYNVTLQYAFAAGASYRFTVELIRRSGAGNISATPAAFSTITDEPVIIL